MKNTKLGDRKLKITPKLQKGKVKQQQSLSGETLKVQCVIVGIHQPDTVVSMDWSNYETCVTKTFSEVTLNYKVSHTH